MDENDLQHLVYTAYNHRGPFAIRIARGAATGAALDSDLRELPIGKGSVVREGGDVVVFGLGKAAGAAVEAAEMLAGYGISCGVVNPIFVKPLDVDLLLDRGAQRPSHRHSRRERAGRRVRLGCARSPRPGRDRGRTGPSYRHAGLFHRARHRCRSTAPAPAGRRGYRPTGPERLLPRGGTVPTGRGRTGPWPQAPSRPSRISGLCGGCSRLRRAGRPRRASPRQGPRRASRYGPIPHGGRHRTGRRPAPGPAVSLA